MFLDGAWHTIDARRRASRISLRRIGSMSSRLQQAVLTPLLGVGDVRTDKRIDFVGGARGTAELEHARELRQGGGRVLDVSGQRG